MQEGEEATTPQELRRLREAAGLTQQALATRLGVAAASVYRWEAGKSPISQVVELAVRETCRKRKGAR